MLSTKVKLCQTLTEILVVDMHVHNILTTVKPAFKTEIVSSSLPNATGQALDKGMQRDKHILSQKQTGVTRLTCLKLGNTH